MTPKEIEEYVEKTRIFDTYMWLEKRVPFGHIGSITKCVASKDIVTVDYVDKYGNDYVEIVLTIDIVYEEFLRHLIRNAEARVNDYKKMLENVFRDKASFPPEAEFTVWYKDLLRDGKNRDEHDLKMLREELVYHRQGLNPPFCYPDWKKENGR